jgi:hypothetical protein
MGLGVSPASLAIATRVEYITWQTKVPLLDLLIVSLDGRQFLLKMFLEKPFLRLVAAGSVMLFGLATLVVADITPVDPHGLLATGGDATPISGPTGFFLSPSGGGILVFNYSPGTALSEVDVDVALPDSFLNGFDLKESIFIPSIGQLPSLGSEILTNTDCVNPSSTMFCVAMSYALTPGPTVPAGSNFVLDFDDPGPSGYTGVDAQVADGTYKGDGDDSENRVGGWPDGAAGIVTPIPAVPEPRQYAGLLVGAMALAIYSRRSRNA